MIFNKLKTALLLSLLSGILLLFGNHVTKHQFKYALKIEQQYQVFFLVGTSSMWYCVFKPGR